MAPTTRSTALKREAALEPSTPESKRQRTTNNNQPTAESTSPIGGSSSSPGTNTSLDLTPSSSPASSHGSSTPVTIPTKSEAPARTAPEALPTDQVIWAKGIGYVADSLPSYRCYQGGTYTSGKEVHGIRVSGFTEPRDIMKMNVLVTCVGGDRTSVFLPGTRDEVYIRRDTTPKELKFWENGQKNKRAVLVLADNKHPEWQTGKIDLSCIPYAPGKPRDAWTIILGAYFIETIWAERVQPYEALPPYTVHKIKLCRIDTAKPAWWKDKENLVEAKDTADELASPKHGNCNQCNQGSPAIFADMPWTCLNYTCSAFFTVNEVQLPGDNNLKYSDRFLNSRILVPENLIMPQSKAVPTTDTGSYGTENKLWTGMVCLKCGCCCRRRQWIGWNCDNCDFFHPAAIHHYPVEQVASETIRHTKRIRRGCYNKDQVTILKSSELISQTTFVDKGVVLNIYIVRNTAAQVVGTIVHSRPSKTMLEAANGANSLYHAVETQEEFYKLLKRNPSRCAGSPREVLTRHFQANFGATYHFSVPVPTTAFKDTPDCMLSALTQLSFYGQQATNASLQVLQSGQYTHVQGSTTMDAWKPFNELLALGYMENNKIGWHDDGEGQLTGTVTTLSLGSPATMAWAHNRPGKKEKFLELQLRHGDSVTMCGTQLQAYAVHQVEPEGLRRYALTARTVNFDFYAPDQRPELKACAKLPARIADFDFQGLILSPDEE